MANTYNQIYVQFVISVKNRMPFIKSEWEGRLYDYITTVINNRKNKTLIINGAKDHIHILVSMDNSESPAKLMLCVKQFSTKFVNHYTGVAFGQSPHLTPAYKLMKTRYAG